VAPFTILAVCTGNVCRSPAVERLLAAGLRAGWTLSTDGTDPGVEVCSAGTHAHAGAPVSAPMIPLIEAAGGSVAGFEARQLTESMVQAAGLVIALTRGHRSAVVALHPRAVHRTFTLRELAWLIGTADLAALPAGTLAERLAALVPLVHAARGPVHGPPRIDDVVDPYGRRDRVYREAFDQLAPAVDVIVAAARPGRTH
jgi:protein-tyrosine phosphatase